MNIRPPSPPPFRTLLALPFLLSAMGVLCTSAASARGDDAMPIQMATSGVIAPSAAFIANQSATARPVVSQGFQPAPMPDQDANAPSTYVPRGAELTPALFSHKAEFAGDGYAAASDPDHGLDNRRTPAAGLNWSVPVK